VRKGKKRAQERSGGGSREEERTCKELKREGLQFRGGLGALRKRGRRRSLTEKRLERLRIA
jgi:hypothetical protein